MLIKSGRLECISKSNMVSSNFIISLISSPKIASSSKINIPEDIPCSMPNSEAEQSIPEDKTFLNFLLLIIPIWGNFAPSNATATLSETFIFFAPQII
ncbi:hypothetical protein ES705_36642 [subsurface metagenome]